MPSAVARGFIGVWELGPQWSPGALPLVRRPGGLLPPEADEILANERQI